MGERFDRRMIEGLFLFQQGWVILRCFFVEIPLSFVVFVVQVASITAGCQRRHF